MSQPSILHFTPELGVREDNGTQTLRRDMYILGQGKVWVHGSGVPTACVSLPLYPGANTSQTLRSWLSFINVCENGWVVICQQPKSCVLTGLPAIVFPQVQLSRLLLAAKRRTPVQRMDPSSCTKQIMQGAISGIFF